MSFFQTLLYILLLVLIAYFGLANAIIHLINYFKFYKPFTKRLLEYDVFTDKAYAGVVKGRFTGNLVVLLVSLGVLVFGCIKLGGTATAASVVCLLAGLLLYSKKLRYELWNVQQFVKQYKEYLDKEKFSRFIRREYDISLEKLSDPYFVTQRIQRKGK